MKQLTCEMCGGIDLLKLDGMYVCQNCGTKYSVEEAKKMMIEGTVDVQGTVKVDNTEAVERFLQNAHRAKAKQDWDETEKYYNLVEASQPDNWEAVYYSAYAKIMRFQTDIQHIIPAINVLLNSMDQVIYLVEKLPQTDEELFLSKISEELKEMTTQLGNDAKASGLGHLIMLSHELKVRGELAKIHYAFADEISAKIGKYELAKQLILENYKLGNLLTIQAYVANQQYLINKGDVQTYNEALNQNRILRKQYVEKTKKLDPSYVEPREPGGCYVATAVYGSYDCPEVWALRRYRDNTLDKTWYGRAFIKIYYKVSPKIVKYFGNTNWFKKMWRGKLDKMVENLKSKGIEDTPYEDKKY